MVQEKSAISSVGIWGSVMGILTGVIAAVQDPTVLAVIPPNAIPYVSAVAALVALIGRLKAKKQITSLLPQ